MKKRLYILIFVLFAILALPAGASLPLVVDQADVLSAEEETELAAFLQEKSDIINGDLVVLTVPSLEGQDAQACADDYFDYSGYGRGDTWDGALFLLAMEERQWAISTCGSVFLAMTDAALDELEETVVPYLSAGNYQTAFREYAVITARYCGDNSLWDDGYAPDDYGIGYVPDDYGTGYAPSYGGEDTGFGPEWILISLVVGFLIALIPMGILKGQLHSVQMQTGAGAYQTSGVKITGARDLFLYRNMTKKAIPRDPPTSSGGGGRHISSSGRTHGGRSGGF